MSFIKNQEVYLPYLDKAIEETLVKNFSCANNDHVILELSIPGLPVPEVNSHATIKMGYILINIVAQHSSLLKDERDAVNLHIISNFQIQ